MITIYYKHTLSKPDEWTVRLDATFSKYQLIADESLTQPKLIEGDKQIEGIAAIDAYIESLEQLVNGWYEDRCDKYEFDADGK
ncbi:hypothetical protein [Mucilaginibacter pedocola]|uniref:Uncharacterized protein n=1 Tax=Mucilaginibacter pedocola TaxID=1792845 RepID=A0A1S9P802_9SPHI|nr:hypothetical protein [Mucilaginibacter pedocola]OOQ56778.1 hypothetical protein BC343_17475 [Mucilaginibacter pedocola]